MTPRNVNDNDKQQKSGATTDESFEKVASDAGLDPEQALDYRAADQGRNVEPSLQTTIEPKESEKGKKGKRGRKAKGAAAAEKEAGGKGFTKRTIRDQARCSFCGNLMTQSTNMNFHELTGYKIPKKADGKTPAYKSPPGAPSGKLVAVFCDDCENVLQSGTSYRDFRTALVEKDDGTIQNIPVTDLMV